MKKVTKAYEEIFKVMRKHKDIIVLDIEALEMTSNIHLFALELKDVYGLNIDLKQVTSLGYNSFGEWKKIGLFGEKHRRLISCSVDGRHPEDEILFTFSFPTGPYIFGDGGFFGKDYPVLFFQKFWLELKTYNPDYTDDANHSLYWKLENAKEMFNEFDSILKKYLDLNREDVKQRRIEKMEKDLELLRKQ